MLFGSRRFAKRAADRFASRLRGRDAVAAACKPVCEPLESRQLLTALVNGRFAGTGTFFDGRTVFEYRQANTNSIIRISVKGNITAEFIGGRVDNTQPHGVAVTDLLPATVTQSDVFLFEIYVAKSDINSTISIAQVPDLAAQDRPMDPFAGGPSIRINDASGRGTQLLSLADGAAYIGAQTATSVQAPGNNIPFYEADQRRFGLRPTSAGQLFAGLQVAPGNDLGQFFLGGTITGVVNVGGDMTTFYAGNILTGLPTGVSSTSSAKTDTRIPNRNFHIGGDLRNLVSAHSAGTISLVQTPPIENIVYKTGFDLDVDGRVGQIKTLDSFLGQAVIQNRSTITGPGAAQKEFEVRGSPLPPGDISYFDPQFFGNNIGVGGKTLDARFRNDTFDTAQWLGSARSGSLRNNNAIDLYGSLGNGNGADAPGVFDRLDYYAVPMLAGQSMQVRVVDRLVGALDETPAQFAVIDPDGRLIATSYSNVNQLAHNGEPLKITADRPGAYRIVVGLFGDKNFNGLEGGEPNNAIDPTPYELQVTNFGDLALGGLIAGGNIATLDTGDKGIQVINGDLGEVRAGTQQTANTTGSGTIFSTSPQWYLPQGNFRVLEAGDLGILALVGGLVDYQETSGPDLLIRKGALGLVRTFDTTATTGLLSINDDFDELNFNGPFPTSNSDLTQSYSSLAVAGDIQLVDAAADLEGTYLSKQGIGTIRAASVGVLAGQFTSLFPVFIADADHKRSDGTIDLISVTGNLVSPAIFTGPNGNVRYIDVGGTIARDQFFGGGVPDVTNSAPGATVTVTDDSGTQIRMTPTPLNTGFGSGLSGSPTINNSQLSVTTLPIRSGGSVILDVTVNQTSILNGFGQSPGLSVTAGALGASREAEISNITIGSTIATGQTVTFNAATQTYTVTAAGGVIPANVTITGKATIDVYQISSVGATTFNSIVNSTPDGEIVNITGTTATLPDVVLLEAETLGIAKAHTASFVAGATVRDNTFPFVQQRNLIQVDDLVTARSRGAMGNILATNIGTLSANSDGKDSGHHEGIDAPVVARQTAAGTVTQGNIVSVNIGDGVLPSGSGLVGLAGIYADGRIGSVNGSGSGHDIRGDIVAANNLAGVAPTTAIGSINLNGGSIVDADIMTTPFVQSEEIFNGTRTVNSRAPGTLNNPSPDIGNITLTGNGGIIGAFILTFNMGQTITGGTGFGIINSFFGTIGGGTDAGIQAGGLGIRSSAVVGGADVTKIDATGTGKRLKTTSFSKSVRYSEKSNFDPYSGIFLDGFNDVHEYLGTTKSHPTIKGRSDTGVIEDSQFLGSRTLGTLSAHRILAHNTTVTRLNGTKTRLSPGDANYPMRISFGEIGTIRTRDVIDGLGLTTGNLGHFKPGANVQNTQINASGEIGEIDAHAALRGTTTIITSGDIGSLSTRSSMFARVNASGDIGSVKVGTDLGSNVFRSNGNLKNLTVNGSILSGAFVNVRKTISTLNIGRNLQANAIVRAHAIGKQSVKGEIVGDIQIV